jgi:hypothetical protein
MSKIMVECSNPNDLKELEAVMEQAAGKCNVTYFKQHAAMVEAGKSTGQRDSARQIAEETGDSPGAVEQRILRGKKQLLQPVAPPLDEQSADPKALLPVSNAWQFSQMAISQLERIQPDDPGAIKALTEVQQEIERRLGKVWIRTTNFRSRCPKCGKSFKTPWESNFIREAVGTAVMNELKTK